MIPKYISEIEKQNTITGEQQGYERLWQFGPLKQRIWIHVNNIYRKLHPYIMTALKINIAICFVLLAIILLMIVYLNKAGTLSWLTSNATFGKDLLVQLAKGVNRELYKRYTWLRSIVNGVISTFSLAVSGANVLLAAGCSQPFLAAVGIAQPAAVPAVLTACWVAGASIAFANIASYTLNEQKEGWEWGGGSNRDKRSSVERNMSSTHFDGLPVRQLSSTLYSVQNMSDPFSSLLMKRDDLPANILTHGSLYSIVDNSTVHVGYQFIADHGTHNKSVVIEPGAEQDAIETWIRCGGDELCQSDANVIVGEHNDDGRNINATGKVRRELSKRTGNSYWQSYNSYGYNGGYVTDWMQWGEVDQMAAAMQYENFMLEQIQPCTDSYSCYGVIQKVCLSGGMSQEQGVDSAWVGEVYINAYGGIDEQCDCG